MPLVRPVKTLLLAALVAFTIGAARADAPATQPAQVNFLAMGDWGTNGGGQRQLAATLADHVAASARAFDAMLMLGDNFYLKLQSVDDPLIQTMFERMYDSKTLSFPFYAALGNHDYKEDNVRFELAYARENPDSRWKIPAKWYCLDFPREKPLVSILVLDSNQPFLTEIDWNRELAWLERELAKPRKGWMIACAHHPLFSNGEHGDNGVLQRQWGPLCKKYKLDFFLCGHDHDLQHLELPGWSISFVLAGGGGANTRPMRIDRRGPFSKSTMGFADLSFTEESARCRLVDRTGAVLHDFERRRDGTIEMLYTVPSDVAVPRTVGSITRGGAVVPTTQSD